MPIPFLLAGLGVVAGVIGAGGHLSAKETNEKAQRRSEEAQELYNSAKRDLERAQNRTEKELMNLGYQKKNILDSSMRQFLRSYNKIKDINITFSAGLNELSNFSIDQQDALQLQEMTNIYSSSIKSGATGAAAGAVIALAASGSLPIVTGTLACAGSALLAGEVTAAAGIAGSALSFGAAMTPLAAVAAPVVLFTGISASMKADENLEKANVMYAEAEEASEKMKVSETLCNAISDKSEMFSDLLGELNEMFADCAEILEGVIRNREGRFFKKKLKSADFTENEINLIAVTRALAGAVKSVIDTPMLTDFGEISDEAEDVYYNTCKSLPCFSDNVAEVKSVDYGVKPVVQSNGGSYDNRKSKSSKNVKNPIIRFILWITKVAIVVVIVLGIIKVFNFQKSDKTLESELVDSSTVIETVYETAATEITTLQTTDNKNNLSEMQSEINEKQKEKVSEVVTTTSLAITVAPETVATIESEVNTEYIVEETVTTASITDIPITENDFTTAYVPIVEQEPINTAKYDVVEVDSAEWDRKGEAYFTMDRLSAYDSNKNYFYYFKDKNRDVVYKYDLNLNTTSQCISIQNLPIDNKTNICCYSLMPNPYDGCVYLFGGGAEDNRNWFYNMTTQELIMDQVDKYVFDDFYFISDTSYILCGTDKYAYIYTMGNTEQEVTKVKYRDDASYYMHYMFSHNKSIYSVNSSGLQRSLFKIGNAYSPNITWINKIFEDGFNSSFCYFKNYLYAKDDHNYIYKYDVDNLTMDIYISPEDFYNTNEYIKCYGLQMTNDGGFLTYDAVNKKIKYVKPN